MNKPIWLKHFCTILCVVVLIGICPLTSVSSAENGSRDNTSISAVNHTNTSKDDLATFLNHLKNNDIKSIFGFDIDEPLENYAYYTTGQYTHENGYKLKNNTFQEVWFYPNTNENNKTEKFSIFLALDLSEFGITFNSDSPEKIYKILGYPNQYEQIMELDNLLYSQYEFEESSLFIALNNDKTMRYFHYSLNTDANLGNNTMTLVITIVSCVIALGIVAFVFVLVMRKKRKTKNVNT